MSIAEICPVRRDGKDGGKMMGLLQMPANAVVKMRGKWGDVETTVAKDRPQ